jgi:hypothetical protein
MKRQGGDFDAEDANDAKRASTVKYFEERGTPTVPSSESVNVNKELTDILLQVGQNERSAGRIVKYNVYGL